MAVAVDLCKGSPITSGLIDNNTPELKIIPLLDRPYHPQSISNFRNEEENDRQYMMDVDKDNISLLLTITNQ